ncbi:MAG: winged helix-turn-helix transcriptional regulator [Cyclobacteriaceae bacterium]|nr:winged helix-turn-helix transcriptional regulator [Cyclobacteriaceae bacterium]
MASSFSLAEQERKIESKIVVALERVSEAFRVLLWNESKEFALSPIQVQILIFLLFHTQEKCKVGYLADEFNMTKATISDSVKVLLQKKLVDKIQDEYDTRSFTIRLTPKGKEIAKKSSLFTGQFEKPLNQLTLSQKEVMLNGLLRLIYDLNRAGVITVQRMCFTCNHYEVTGSKQYCTLLQATLHDKDLRVDCPEHEMLA